MNVRQFSRLISKCLFIVAVAVSTPCYAITAESIEVGFSPDGGGEALILKVISRARRDIHLAAYSFTSKPVIEALLVAKRRGVSVRVLVDRKHNIGAQSGRAALNILVNAGITVRTISVYAIHHDKFIIVDGHHVQTGSFNYSQSAAKANSENVLVMWGADGIAQQYLSHWHSRWQRGVDYHSPY